MLHRSLAWQSKIVFVAAESRQVQFAWSHESQQAALSVVFNYRLILAKHAGHMQLFFSPFCL